MRAYQGTRAIAKTHVPRLKFPAPATVETWVADAAGDPLLVVMAQPAASLAGELRRLIPELRAMVGDDRRVLVGFDRGGWSPALFADLHAAGFDTLTWRKGTDRRHRRGRLSPSTPISTSTAAPTPGGWPTPRPPSTSPRGRARARCSRCARSACSMPPRTRQMHILTTRADLPAAEIRYRMGSRWRQENHYRYARIHFDLDSHDTYRAGDDDPTRMVPNPAKKPAYRRSKKPGAHCIGPKPPATLRCWPRILPAAGTPPLLTNTMINTINADVHAAQAALDAAPPSTRRSPPGYPWPRSHPGQQVLDTETKLIHHAIRIAAFNTAQSAGPCDR